jgi:biopolymer transport protein ExbB/TolQ
MPTWLIIVIVILAVLAIGGAIARNRQLARSRPAFERALAQVDQDLAAAAASDRGWDRAHLESSARRIFTEQLGAQPDELTLVEVIDRPGTDDDQAVFDVNAGGTHHRLVLGRRDGDWVNAP